MFLEVAGKPLPQPLRIHACTDAPMAEGVWGGEKPKHLVSLKDSMWPEEVIDKITQIFKAIGILDPLGQKLVEPYAVVFGCKNVEGRQDLSGVNWELAVDYFTFEAASVTRDEKVHALQKRALKKYGGHFSHYAVYEDYSGQSRCHIQTVKNAICQ